MEVKGTLKKILEIQEFKNNFKKRSIILQTSEDYPQTLQIELVNDNCNLINNYSVGSFIKVNINLRGKEWVNPEGVSKYFNTIQGWKISNTMPEVKNNMQNEARDQKNDDLPF